MLTSPLPDIANTCIELAVWGAAGAPVPPPPIVKQITLGCYVRGSGHRRFVETGTYLGHTTSLIASLGVEIDTIELSELLHGYNLKDFADVPNVRCHRGDSTNVLPGILKTLDTPAVFWLDGHYSAGNTAHGDKVTPIVEELELLRGHDIRNHVILIDDMRGFGVNGYPPVEWVLEMGRKIVPDAEPRLFNDSLILATPDQHAAAEAQRTIITRQFLLNEAAPAQDLPVPAAEAEICEVRRRPHSPPSYAAGCKTQDEVISRIFEIIGVSNRTLVDAGIGDSWHDGLVHRNLTFEGWKAVYVEHTARSADNLKSIFSNAGKQADTTVIKRSLSYPADAGVLDEIIDRHVGGGRLDLLGLRLRGPEWQALEGLRHRPRVIGVLFNPSIPAIVEYVQEDGPNVHKGASLLALQILLQEKGYLLVHVGRLAVFVDHMEAGRLALPDHSLRSLWDGGDWQSRIMVAFDGTLVLGGNKRLLWNRIGEGKNVFEQEDLQVIFKNFRRLVW